jgi:hypothetical protein
MRLSHGFVRGEVLSCIYHGWSYSQAGTCVRIPAHPGLTPPETIRVVTHRVEEADGIIWITAGEPTAGPPRLAGRIPLRSLTAKAGLAAIEAVAGANARPEGLVWQVPNAPAMRLLLVSHRDDETLIHVLLAEALSPSERIAASRAIESLRRAAEEFQRKGSRHAA